MQRIFLLFTILLTATAAAHSQQGWYTSYSMNPAQTLQEIEFYDANLGYTVSSLYNGSTYNIYKTTNAGATWTAQNSGFTSTRLMAIEIMSPDTAFISGNDGIILKTTNGGGLTQVALTSDEIPEHTKLFQNYPNPFNPETKIVYGVGSQEFVELAVFDLLGRKVATLVSEVKRPGTHEVPFNASELSSGMYFYRMRTSSGFTSIKRMMVLR